MPNGKTHVIAGVVCGAFTSVAIQHQIEKDNVNFGQVLLASGVGGVTGKLPDVLEPATNPHHRQFFHSFAFGALLGWVGVKGYKKLKERRSRVKNTLDNSFDTIDLLLVVAIIVIAVYILHLIMDGFTPKGLPII